MASTATNNRPRQRLRHQVTEVASTIGKAAVATGKATADAVRHPGATAGRARRTSQALPLMWESVKPVLTGHVTDWRREYAYTLGEQAFVYGFPYIYNAGLRRRWVSLEPDTDATPYAPVHHFWHARKLFDAYDRQGLCSTPGCVRSQAANCSALRPAHNSIGGGCPHPPATCRRHPHTARSRRHPALAESTSTAAACASAGTVRPSATVTRSGSAAAGHRPGRRAGPQPSPPDAAAAGCGAGSVPSAPRPARQTSADRSPGCRRTTDAPTARSAPGDRRQRHRPRCGHSGCAPAPTQCRQPVRC